VIASSSSSAIKWSAPTASDFPYRDLGFVFASALNTLTSVGNSTTLLLDNRTPENKSYEKYGSTGQILTAALSGGTVTVTSVTNTAVPEPLTILGAATAVGFGAAFKRRALKNIKKG
jgi:hypothetical protein